MGEHVPQKWFETYSTCVACGTNNIVQLRLISAVSDNNLAAYI